MTTDLITTPPAFVAVPMMDADEARATIGQIRAHLDGARRLLLDLEEREGWRALGYESWRACVVAEFGQSQAYLYRQLTAAKIERDLDSPIGEIPESHLRPLAALDTPDQRRAALDRADELAGEAKRTAAHVQQAVEQVATPAPALDAILLRLDAHGYTRAGVPTQRGSTTYHHFQEMATGEELILAEGELPYILAQLDHKEAKAQERRQQYQDARDRFDRLGYVLAKDSAPDRYTLGQPGKVGIANMQWHAVQSRLEVVERQAKARADDLAVGQRTDPNKPDPREPPPADDIPHLPPDYKVAQQRALGLGYYLDMAASGAFTLTRATDNAPAGGAVDWPAMLDLLERKAQQPAPAADTADADDARRRQWAAEHVRMLKKQLPLITTEDTATLAYAIEALHNCKEGTEAAHIINVLWAYLDCDVDEVTP
jgi:hypothetical protein